MYNTRPRVFSNDDHQRLPYVDFAAANPAIPLKENWPERWTVLTKDCETIMNDLLSLEVRPDDVFVNTYIKTGTTWMQETAWLLLNNLDFDTAKKIPLPERSPYLDWTGLFPHVPNSVETVKNTPSPRLIKTHMSPCLLPKQVWEKKSKVIFVARNVKDTIVSSYHFVKDLGSWDGDMDQYAIDFMKNEIVFTPYIDRVVDFWRMRNESHICFVTYEEMKRDLSAVIQRLCKFLGRPQLTADELKRTIDHLSFNKMRDNKQTNLTKEFKTVMAPALPVQEKFEFMRRGIIGSYKDEISEETQRKLNEWSTAYFAKYGLKEEDIFGAL